MNEKHVFASSDKFCVHCGLPIGAKCHVSLEGFQVVEEAYGIAAKSTIKKLTKILTGKAKDMVPDIKKYIAYLKREYSA